MTSTVDRGQLAFDVGRLRGWLDALSPAPADTMEVATDVMRFLERSFADDRAIGGPPSVPLTTFAGVRILERPDFPPGYSELVYPDGRREPLRGRR